MVTVGTLGQSVVYKSFPFVLMLGYREGFVVEAVMSTHSNTGSCHDNWKDFSPSCAHFTESLQFGTDLTTLSHEENIPEGSCNLFRRVLCLQNLK